MTRQAAGDFVPVRGWFRINLQMNCMPPVIRKERNINGSNDEKFVFGIDQRIAIHSLESPAPIQPLAHAESSRKNASHKSMCPGKCAIMPAMIKGRVHQFGIRRVRRSYRVTASK